VKPTPLRRVLAHTFGIVAGTSALICAGVVVKECATDAMSLREILWLVAAVIVALPLGWMLGFLGLTTIGPGIFQVICWWNGGPFQVRDSVHILAGRYRGRVATVYAVWEPRGEVRLDLGEPAAADYSDVISCLEICRKTDPSE
jgi:hypothetical protein